MQILQRFRNKTLQRQYARTLGAFWVLTAVHQEAFAQSLGGLSRARTTLQTLKDNLDIILPIAAVIIGVIIFVLYSAEVMRKDDAIRWGIGVLLAGSAAELVVLLWK
ncbi:hypothetical protein CDEF62S_00529 [Castellaniella defragrans]